MTSLYSDASSSVSSKPRQMNEEASWERLNEDGQKRKDKNSIFSTSPWDREKKEKLQQEQVLDARRARDEEIAHLEAVVDKSDKQKEWLRILRLEQEFQRRAEQEPDEEEGSVCSDSSSTDSDKIANFPRDKLTVIPNERIGLKLLDELLDNPTPCENRNKEREISHKSPSEKHFIPLDVTIPDNVIQTSSLPLANNILKISSDQPQGSCRASKPPVPAPRPSKAVMTTPDIQKSTMAEMPLDNCQFNSKVLSDMDANVSSLTKLEISDSSAFFCSTDNDEHSSVDSPQDNWMIEVPNNYTERDEAPRIKQNGNNSNSDQSRIYENIKPADYHYLRTQTGGYNSHTLPKSTNVGSNTTNAKDARNGSRHTEKKFPVMGVSSTLTKKSNGFVPSDVDILPSLYASYKAQNGYVKEVPSDIADKSPEFKKLWISRPEKLTFQDKIRKFSLQAGEDDPPRDRVKNSRAQREIEIKFSDAQKRALGLQKATEN